MDKSDLPEVKLVINYKVPGKCWYKRYQRLPIISVTLIKKFSIPNFIG